MMRPTQATTSAIPIAVIVLVMGVLFWPQTSPGQTVAQSQARYKACMTKVATDPQTAFDDAVQWEGLGGGLAARHCALAALMAIGLYAEAAQGFEKLADAVRADKAFKARLLVQGVRAWIAADNPERATALADTALNMTAETSPETITTLMLRAQALALQGAYWDAADDLNRVIDSQPQNAEALVLRGAAYRQLDALDLALEDLDRALKIEPTHPEGLLERGIVYRLQGRKQAARTDWRRLIASAPDGPAGRTAKTNLYRLDSGLN